MMDLPCVDTVVDGLLVRVPMRKYMISVQRRETDGYGTGMG